MKMPFGKHKGTNVDKIPKDYLQWLLKECDLYTPLKTAVEEAFYPKIYTFRVDVTRASKGNGSYFVDAVSKTAAKKMVRRSTKGRANYKIKNLGRLN